MDRLVQTVYKLNRLLKFVLFILLAYLINFYYIYIIIKDLITI